MGLFRRNSDARLDELKRQVREVQGDIEDLREALLKLKAAHESLRGYTYALKAKHVAGIRPEETETPTTTMSKAELRKQLGIKPWEHKHE